MEKSYNPEAIEQRWYKFWQDLSYFEPTDAGKPYCIMLPPPNVTGSLFGNPARIMPGSPPKWWLNAS
jgi:valyl-tRNA synthetase